MSNLNKLIESSKGNGEISLTIKGILMGLAPLIIVVMQQYDVNISQTDFAELVELIVGAISIVMIAIGAIRKVINEFKNLSTKN